MRTARQLSLLAIRYWRSCETEVLIARERVHGRTYGAEDHLRVCVRARLVCECVRGRFEPVTNRWRPPRPDLIRHCVRFRPENKNDARASSHTRADNALWCIRAV